ncbi:MULTISPECIES: aminodeoxychorismate/anthranilate synthase component II [unclassified Niallia]|uniref:aminodeoxychorismate/anthranilate synthase component II n=1 Tax=unclassified Niallia TaxID=2837522 RepID=UPI001EDABBF3|nr:MULTISPECIES: aminodeoxychorismate/anthranilate synthase component II [unclassified Niallia]MDL0437333.1 aminodeoxychorismate/anthranilate synthase component II [Niallia sp. SS-2023]UPO87749.1 aminodeoxychorismate/anthranilate synthase component II [Niallia sp. Man26]
MIYMIDNYDSFTYNLVQYLGSLGSDLTVSRNNKTSLEEIRRVNPEYLMISPGPCTPNEAGISLEAISAFAGKLPIFGVCLGHQAIAQAFGGKVIRAENLMHGKTSPIYHDNKTIFEGLPNPFPATRYHSLLVEKTSLPDCLEVSAWTKEGEIMALRHKELPIEAVQFHPESIMTTAGMDILANFVELYKKGAAS